METSFFVSIFIHLKNNIQCTSKLYYCIINKLQNNTFALLWYYNFGGTVYTVFLREYE